MTDLWVVFGVAALLLRAGFALQLAGISRSKNTVSTLFRAMVEIAIGILAYWLIGAAIHGHRGDVANPTDASALFVAATFLIGPGVIAGAGLERSRSSLFIAAAALMPGLITPLTWRVLHWHWLVQSGFVDEAGATFIHFSAGLAAMVVAVMLGPRIGKYNRDGSTNAILGHNFPLAMAGTFLMFIMWIPYVSGYAADAPRAALNAALAGATGVVAAYIYCEFRYGRQDVFLVLGGLVGGLVSITAGADRLSPIWAIVTGAVAGVIVPYAIVRIDLVWKIDDPASGIAIHGLGGLWSAVAIAVLAPGTWSERAGRLWAEAVGLAIVAVITLAIVVPVLLILRGTVKIRSREADEFDGLDLAQYDMNAYPDFQQTTIKSYHLREM